MKFRHPSRGTNAVIFLPFLMSCTRTHLRMAEFGCLASTPLQHSQQYTTFPTLCHVAFIDAQRTDSSMPHFAASSL